MARVRYINKFAFTPGFTADLASAEYHPVDGKFPPPPPPILISGKQCIVVIEW